MRLSLLLAALLNVVIAPFSFAQTFPPPGTDSITSRLAIDLDVPPLGSINETIIMNNDMRVVRGTPYTNPQGRQQIDMTVLRWTSSGFSTVLNQSITFQLSPGVTQPTSTVIANQTTAAYPATTTFNVLHDVRVGGVLVGSQLTGTASAAQMMVVPPQGIDVFTVTKSISLPGGAVLGTGNSPCSVCDTNFPGVAVSVPTISWLGMVVLSVSLLALGAWCLLRGRNATSLSRT